MNDFNTEAIHKAKAQKLFNEKVTEKYNDPSGRRGPFYDGIIDPDTYWNKDKNKFRILWILKEPYYDVDEIGPYGGPCFYADRLKENPLSYSQIDTWKNIAYVSYGILNG